MGYRKNTIILLFLALMLMNARCFDTVQAETYEYDSLHRLTKVIYDDGSVVTYSYDKNGNILGTSVGLNTNSPEPAVSSEPILEASHFPVLPSSPVQSPDIFRPGLTESPDVSDILPTGLPSIIKPSPAGTPIVSGPLPSSGSGNQETERGSLTIVAVDDSLGTLLEGVRVEIYYQGTKMDSGVTGNDGLFQLTELEIGLYQFVVISVPEEYDFPANNTGTISVQAGGNSEAKILLSRKSIGNNVISDNAPFNTAEASSAPIAEAGEINHGGQEQTVTEDEGGYAGSRDRKAPTINLKSNKTYHRAKRVVIKDDSGIAKIRVNGKRVKCKKGARKVVFRLKNYKIKKGKCKIIAIDINANKKTVKFRVR